MTTKPCALCLSPLTPVMGNWDSLQPAGGCEIQVIAFYGSDALDLSPMGSTIFEGVLCDDCAVRLVRNMRQV